MGFVLVTGAMSAAPDPELETAGIGGCAMRAEIFTLAGLAPEPDDLAYRVAFFLADTAPAALNAPVAGTAPGQAVTATPLFTPPEGRWLFRRPMPGPSDPDAFELQTPQVYVLYRPRAGSGFVSLGLAGVEAGGGLLSHPAFFGHVSDSLFFAVAPEGDAAACTLNPNDIFNDISAFLDREISRHAHQLKEKSHGG